MQSCFNALADAVNQNITIMDGREAEAGRGYLDPLRKGQSGRFSIIAYIDEINRQIRLSG